MSGEIYDRVVAHPKYQELQSKRNRFSVLLSLIVLGVYYTFVMVACLNPGAFSQPFSEGSVWGTGLLVGFGIQIFAFLMTGVYVFRANSEFDALNRTLIEEAGR